jgi:hypothetical protein
MAERRVLGGVLLVVGVLLAAEGCHRPGRGLGGSYRSTWGQCLMETHGTQAQVRYPRGKMDCTIEGQQLLRCDWESGAATGKARFDLQQDGTLLGRWGRGAREDDGGEWAMVPEGP